MLTLWARLVWSFQERMLSKFLEAEAEQNLGLQREFRYSYGDTSVDLWWRIDLLICNFRPFAHM